MDNHTIRVRIGKHSLFEESKGKGRSECRRGVARRWKCRGAVVAAVKICAMSFKIGGMPGRGIGILAS